MKTHQWLLQWRVWSERCGGCWYWLCPVLWTGLATYKLIIPRLPLLNRLVVLLFISRLLQHHGASKFLHFATSAREIAWPQAVLSAFLLQLDAKNLVFVALLSLINEKYTLQDLSIFWAMGGYQPRPDWPTLSCSMLLVVLFGRAIESELGKSALVLLYLTGGVVTNLFCHIGMASAPVGLAATGGLFALTLGGLLSTLKAMRMKRPSRSTSGFWAWAVFSFQILTAKIQNRSNQTWGRAIKNHQAIINKSNTEMTCYGYEHHQHLFLFLKDKYWALSKLFVNHFGEWMWRDVWKLLCWSTLRLGTTVRRKLLFFSCDCSMFLWYTDCTT